MFTKSYNNIDFYIFFNIYFNLSPKSSEKEKGRKEKWTAAGKITLDLDVEEKRDKEAEKTWNKCAPVDDLFNI